MADIPLPLRSCIVTNLEAGRPLHFSLSVKCGAALMGQPVGSTLDLFTADQMRAYSAAENAALRARVAALTADAERYRWLRDGCCDKGTLATRIAQNEYGMDWDAAIDAARRLD